MSRETESLKSGRRAVLLLAHGTPDVLGEMAEYLSKVTGGRALPQQVVEELQHRYAQIGLRETPGVEAPPLTKWTITQGYLLEQALRREYPVEGRQHMNGPAFWMAMSSASRPGAASENWSTP